MEKPHLSIDKWGIPYFPSSCNFKIELLEIDVLPAAKARGITALSINFILTWYYSYSSAFWNFSYAEPSLSLRRRLITWYAAAGFSHRPLCRSLYAVISCAFIALSSFAGLKVTSEKSSVNFTVEAYSSHMGDL